MRAGEAYASLHICTVSLDFAALTHIEGAKKKAVNACFKNDFKYLRKVPKYQYVPEVIILLD